MEMCRACLATESEMIRINNDCLQNYKLLTNLAIELDNDLPQCMCRMCWDSIEAFVEFRTKCITAEESLHLILQNVNMHIDEKQGLKLQEPVEFDGLNVKLEIDGEDYVHYDEDYSILNIKPEPREIKCRAVKKETKKVKPSDVDTGVKRKRGRPRKNEAQSVPKKKNRHNKIEADSVPKIEKEPTDTSLPCGLCSKSYENRESLFIHLEKHKKGTICSTCKEDFKPWPRLISHRLKHIGENKRRCHICWKVYRVDFYLEYHYLTKHYEGEFPGLACPVCNKHLATARRLKGHLWGAHSRKKYICDYCKKTFGAKNNLRIHMFGHNTQMNYFCDQCSFSSKYHHTLKTHKLKMHADISFKCKVCYRLFEDEVKLEKHACLRTVICPDCGKHLKNSSALGRHMLSHSEARRFACPRCPATFKAQSTLTIHLLKHDNVRPHQCRYCAMRFFTNAVRIKHERVHTGEKPFVCNICDKGFTGNHNLKVHMKVHGLDLVVKRGVEKPPPQDNAHSRPQLASVPLTMANVFLHESLRDVSEPTCCEQSCFTCSKSLAGIDSLDILN